MTINGFDLNSDECVLITRLYLEGKLSVVYLSQKRLVNNLQRKKLLTAKSLLTAGGLLIGLNLVERNPVYRAELTKYYYKGIF